MPPNYEESRQATRDKRILIIGVLGSLGCIAAIVLAVLAALLFFRLAPMGP